MKNCTRREALTMAAVTALAAASAGCSQQAAPQEAPAKSFEPALDTEAKVTLEVIGYFGNFEALDGVMADLGQHYPNLSFNYQQVGGSKEAEYLAANPQVDLFMTSAETLRGKDAALPGLAADLTAAGVDTGDLEDDMLASSRIDGSLLSIPIGQNLTGLTVNEALFEKAGLEIPTTVDELFDCCRKLKAQGLVPIQGPTQKVCAELTSDIVFSVIGRDESVREALASGDVPALQALAPAFDLLDEVVAEGYIDPAVNAEYPEDNYDQAILRFFAGEVPLWVCNTEKVSGMKKRETKSEAFQASPFNYRFIKVPSGKKVGEYAYREPWFGFVASASSDNSAYAVEFMRFLATKDEANAMAGVKGIPSIAKEPVDSEVYQHALDPEQTQGAYTNDGTVTPEISAAWYTVATSYAAGEYASREEALAAFASLAAGR